MLAVSNVQVLYDKAIEAVRDVSLQVAAGKIVALLGSNGAGKSTLLEAISGVLSREDGEIVGGAIDVGGVPLKGKSSREIAELGCVQVPEGRALFATLTAEEGCNATN